MIDQPRGQAADYIIDELCGGNPCVPVSALLAPSYSAVNAMPCSSCPTSCSSHKPMNSSRDLPRYDRVDPIAQRARLNPQLVVRLQVHSEVLGRAEVAPQTDRHVSGDSSLAVGDLIDLDGRPIIKYVVSFGWGGGAES